MPISEHLLNKYGGRAPRYTSYPTAVHFSGAVGSEHVKGWLQGLQSKTASVYVHLPYCKSLCLYCGCNMQVTHNLERISTYIDAVLVELDRVAAQLPYRLNVTTLHLGGGTPSYCRPEDMRRLITELHKAFDITANAEISLEIDPRRLSDEMVQVLGEVGFNRASLGIQDTDPAVQKAIMREQPQQQNIAAVTRLRNAGIKAINVDVLYGLPLQTQTKMRQTIQDILQLSPQRVSLFGYAHVPWMKKHQQVLEQYPLPDAHQRLELFFLAEKLLLEAGYITVGLDHFCLPDDPMAKACQQQVLQRNFMGYTTDEEPVMIGLGASAISQYKQGYAQNESTPAAYVQKIKAGALATVRGVEVSTEDAKRRDLIMDLLCHMRVQVPETMGDVHAQLQDAIAEGLMKKDGDEYLVTELGRPFIRSLATAFDTHFQSQKTARHSRAV